MAKMHGYSRVEGMLFAGNRIHPDEKARINAQLAKGHTIGMGYLKPHKSLAGAPSTREDPYRLDNNSTVRERLRGQTDVFRKLAELTVGGFLPDSWQLSTSNDVLLEEHIHDGRVDLLQSLGQTMLEADAA